MTFDDMIEKQINSAVADQLENNDKLQERLARLEERLASVESTVRALDAGLCSHSQRFETLERRTMSNNLSVRLIGLEESVHNCVTRKEAGDVAYEVIRDADLDELLGSYVKDKVEEVIDDDDFQDRMSYLIDEKLERVEISMKLI